MDFQTDVDDTYVFQNLIFMWRMQMQKLSVDEILARNSVYTISRSRYCDNPQVEKMTYFSLENLPIA